jgi:hypothetical protein
MVIAGKIVAALSGRLLDQGIVPCKECREIFASVYGRPLVSTADRYDHWPPTLEQFLARCLLPPLYLVLRSMASRRPCWPMTRRWRSQASWRSAAASTTRSHCLTGRTPDKCGHLRHIGGVYYPAWVDLPTIEEIADRTKRMVVPLADVEGSLVM